MLIQPIKNPCIVWNIKIFLTTFCQVGPQMLCAKLHANWWNFLGRVWKSKFEISRLAWLVAGTTHVPRLCSGPGFDSRPRLFCCVSLSYPVSCHSLKAVLSIKPEKTKKILEKKNRFKFMLASVTYSKFGEFWGIFRQCNNMGQYMGYGTIWDHANRDLLRPWISEHHFRGGGSCGSCKNSRAMQS